jgi:hypothetical protein
MGYLLLFVVIGCYLLLLVVICCYLLLFVVIGFIGLFCLFGLFDCYVFDWAKQLIIHNS